MFLAPTLMSRCPVSVPELHFPFWKTRSILLYHKYLAHLLFSIWSRHCRSPTHIPSHLTILVVLIESYHEHLRLYSCGFLVSSGKGWNGEELMTQKEFLELEKMPHFPVPWIGLLWDIFILSHRVPFVLEHNKSFSASSLVFSVSFNAINSKEPCFLTLFLQVCDILLWLLWPLTPYSLSLFFTMLLKNEPIREYSMILKRRKSLKSTSWKLWTLIILWYQLIALGIKNKKFLQKCIFLPSSPFNQPYQMVWVAWFTTLGWRNVGGYRILSILWEEYGRILI